MAYDLTTRWTDVLAHHADRCPARDGGRCSCGPLGYRAVVEDPETHRPVSSPLLPTPGEARAWHAEQVAAVDAVRAAARVDRVSVLADELLQAAADGRATNRRGRQYTDSALRDLRTRLTRHVVPQLGSVPIGNLRVQDVQDLADHLSAGGMSERRVRTVVSAVRSLADYAVERGLIDVNPVDEVELPADGEPPRVAVRDGGWVATDEQPAFATAAMSAVSGPEAAATGPQAANGSVGAAGAQASSGGLIAEAATLPDRAIWWALKVVVLVFVLVILVLVAESV